MLDSLIVYLQQADPAAVYVFLFFTAFLENVVPPIPGDLPVAFIGYMVHYTTLSFFSALIASTLGSTAGFMLVFLLIRHFGTSLYAVDGGSADHGFLRSVHRFFPPSEMAELRARFASHGYVAVLLNRFLFGSRALISVMVGFMRLRVLPVLVATVISATAWNVLLLYGGLFLGRNWQSIGAYVGLYSAPVTGIFFLFLFFSVWKFLRRRKQREE